MLTNNIRNLDKLLRRFVAIHEGMRQRDKSWYKSMGTTVGGSEVAALLGCNPYATSHDIVASKVALLQGKDSWAGGGPACWWGVLFEDIIAMYVEIDLGMPVRGDEICVQRWPGHRNSPDGYIVARLARRAAVRAHTACASCAGATGAPSGAEGATVAHAHEAQEDDLVLWTSDMCESLAEQAQIMLLEFKCPLSRQPTGDVPPQYRPQLWSGLAVSPVASAGLFVDAVFRRCALADLGPGPAFDVEYHRRREPESWPGAVAWGLIGVYAPALDAPAWVRRGWRGPAWAAGDPDADSKIGDAAMVAWRLRTDAKAAGLAELADSSGLADLSGLSVEADESDESDLADDADSPKHVLSRLGILDLGSCEKPIFDRALDMVNSRRFLSRRLKPCFRAAPLPLRAAAKELRRGLPLHTPEEVVAAIEGLRSAPRHYELLGVVPWKLFDVAYAPVARHRDFRGLTAPLIADVHARVAAALAAPDPDAHLRAARRAAARPRAARDAATASELQDLFDNV